jgi:hypothetical protein
MYLGMNGNHKTARGPMDIHWEAGGPFFCLRYEHVLI